MGGDGTAALIAAMSNTSAPSAWVAQSHYGIGEADRPFVLSLPFCTLWLLLVTAIPYLGTCAYYSWFDHRPERYRRCKIQPNAPALTPAERGEAWRVSMMNVLFWDVVFGIGIACVPATLWLACVLPPPPSLSCVVDS